MMSRKERAGTPKLSTAQLNAETMFSSTSTLSILLLLLLVTTVAQENRCENRSGIVRNEGACLCGNTNPQQCQINFFCYAPNSDCSNKTLPDWFKPCVIMSKGAATGENNKTEEQLSACACMSKGESINESTVCTSAATTGLFCVNGACRCGPGNQRKEKGTRSSADRSSTPTGLGCEPCPAGKFVKSPDKQCEKCPQGAYLLDSDGLGNKMCRICFAGKYHDHNEDDALTSPCKNCPANTFIIDDEDDPRKHKEIGDCNECKEGQFSNVGAQYCSFCPVGRYEMMLSNGIVGTGCVDCEPGLFQDQEGQKSCDACPAGMHQSNPAKSFCFECAPGRYQKEEGKATCESCSAGTYRGEKNDPTKCSSCKVGLTSSSVGSAVCLPCETGMFGVVVSVNPAVDPLLLLPRGQCVSCPDGYYTDTRGRNACDPAVECPEGKEPNVGRNACERPDWTTAESCSNEEMLDDYSNDRSNDKQRWTCVQCPKGLSCTGSVTVSDARAMFGYARCPILNQFTVVNFTFAECVQGDACLGAPNSKKSGRYFEETANGTWIDLALVDSMIESCGARRANLSATNLRCSQCADGFYLIGETNECKECGGDSSEATWMVGGAGVAFLLFFLLLLFLKMRFSQGRRRSEDSTVRRTILGHIQMVAIVMRLNVSWPTSVTTFLNVFASAQQVSEVTKLACTNSFDSSSDVTYVFLVMYSVLPFAMLPISFFYWFILVPRSDVFSCGVKLVASSLCPKHNPFRLELRLRKRPRRRHVAYQQRKLVDKKADKKKVNAKGQHKRSTRDAWLYTNILFLWMMMPSILRQSFEMLQRVKVCDQSRWARDDLVDFDGPRHVLFKYVVAVPSIVLYGCLVPALAFLYVSRHQDRQQNRKLMFRFGLLFSGYSPKFWWWEMISWFRKLSIILIVTFIHRNEQQLHFALGMLIFLLYVQEYARPFYLLKPPNATVRTTQLRLHRLETGSLLILTIMVWAAVFFELTSTTAQQDKKDSLFLSFLGVFVLSINIIFLLLIGMSYVQAFGRKHQQLSQQLMRAWRKRFASLGNENETANTDVVVELQTLKKEEDVVEMVEKDVEESNLVAAESSGAAASTRDDAARISKEDADLALGNIPEEWLQGRTEAGEAYYYHKDTLETKTKWKKEDSIDDRLHPVEGGWDW